MSQELNQEFTIELAVAKDIARKAGIVMLRYFDNDKATEIKADNSPVTVADKEINRLVIDELSKHFHDGVIGEEESTATYGAGRRWICDPIDGTKGYIVGLPTAMFSLGFIIDGVPILGVAYDPFLDRLYTALRGDGSYCNDMRLHVSSKGLSGQYVGLTSSPKRTPLYKDFIERLSKDGADFASFSGGVYKMCLVARGSLVGYLDAGLNPHDTAAGQLIVEEAGGTVTDFKGNALEYNHTFKGALFSNTLVHLELLKALNGVEL